jgi:hypothetical protein
MLRFPNERASLDGGGCLEWTDCWMKTHLVAFVPSLSNGAQYTYPVCRVVYVSSTDAKHEGVGVDRVHSDDVDITSDRALVSRHSVPARAAPYNPSCIFQNGTTCSAKPGLVKSRSSGDKRGKGPMALRGPFCLECERRLMDL